MPVNTGQNWFGLPIFTPDIGKTIVRHIARAFGNLLIDKALFISALPERGRVVPEMDEPSAREIIHGFYRIMYKVFHNPSLVYVLRFWHAARGEPELGHSRP